LPKLLACWVCKDKVLSLCVVYLTSMPGSHRIVPHAVDLRTTQSTLSALYGRSSVCAASVGPWLFAGFAPSPSCCLCVFDGCCKFILSCSALGDSTAGICQQHSCWASQLLGPLVHPMSTGYSKQHLCAGASPCCPCFCSPGLCWWLCYLLGACAGFWCCLYSCVQASFSIRA
jgi:hypothetical protein